MRLRSREIGFGKAPQNEYRALPLLFRRIRSVTGGYGWNAVLLALAVIIAPAASAIAEDRAASVLEPAISASEAGDFQTEEEEGEAADTALEPAMAQSAKKGLKYGSILEYWFLEPGEPVSRMPADISLSGMIDDSKQIFSGASMLRDGELKKYASRQGVLRWTSYIRVAKPGKHVFALSSVGLTEASTKYSGVALAINGEVKTRAAADRDGSAVVDFAAPGWYAVQVWLWWSHNRKPAFQDYGATLKIREPGSLSLRPVTRRDIYYKQP